MAHHAVSSSQTIFLNKKHEHLWSKDEIRKDKISASQEPSEVTDRARPLTRGPTLIPAFRP